MRDPRSHRRYVTAAKAFIAARSPGIACALCGLAVDTRLPSTVADGPTIEHTLPVRRILLIAQTQAEALALACDTSLWGISHRRCNDRQGGQVQADMKAGRTEVVYEPSRDW